VKAPTESAFIRQVLTLARLRSWRSVHFRPGMTRGGRWSTAYQGQGVGFPDLLLLRGPRLVVAELKVGRNRETPEQREWLAAFARLDGDVAVFTWTPADWADIERALA
jgi:hypothetical protein